MMKISALFFCLLAFLHTGCNRKPPPLGGGPVDVVVQTIEAKTIPAVFEYVGVAASSHEVEIRAQVEGYLKSIDYIEGSDVKEGALLFQIDPRPYQAALDDASAVLARSNAVLWDSTRTVERLKPLYAENAASLRDLDNATAKMLSAQADVDAAKAKVEVAQINLGYTTIASPVTGMSGKSNFRTGALIKASQTLLTTISVTHPIWINFSVSDRDDLYARREIAAGRLKFPEQDNFTLGVVLADQSRYPETGKVNFTSPTYDTKTGTMLVRGVVPNPKGVIRPGQFVRVLVQGAVRPNAISVPQKSVMQSKRGMFVLIVNNEEKAETRMVEAGDWDGNNWIIKSGLKPGDRLIVEGVNKVVEGTPVKIVPGKTANTQQQSKLS